jgi:DNA-binding CsgD family transcriptional regulator
VRTIKRGVPTVVTSQEIIDDASFARTEFCNDWCEKLDIFQMVAATCQVSDDLIGEIGFARPRWMDRFEESDRGTIRRLLPHLQRALQLHYRLSVAEQKSTLMLGCFERLAVAVMVVDRESRVLFANDVAERVLSRSAGITLSRGALRPQDPRQGPRLAHLVAMAARTSSGQGADAGGIVTLPRPVGAPLSLLVSPFRVATAGFGPQRPAAVIIFSDPDTKASSSEEVLAQTYGLTKAEASLLAALVEGQSPNEYASKRGLSAHTPKKHLQRIFQKTGYRRQIDLVRAIIANPALSRDGK